MLLFVVLLCGCALTATAGSRAITPGVGRLQFNSASLNWTNAVKTCADFGGYLAIAQSPAEAAALQRLMKLNGAVETHLGFHDLYVEGKYLTILDQELDTVGYQQWAPDAPEASTQSNCGSLTTEGLMSSNCSLLLPSICQLPLWDAYELVGNHGYYKYHAYASWTEAWETCRKEGASLLVLRSQQEFDDLLARFGGEISSRFIQYGAHHKFANYEFVTIYGEPLERSGYSVWAPNEPGNYADNWSKSVLSLGMTSKFPERGLAATVDTNRLEFICKHDLFL